MYELLNLHNVVSLVIRYEDMQADKVKEIKKILSFLNISSCSDSEMEAQLQEDFTAFKRFV